jgi:phytoene desaturase
MAKKFGAKIYYNSLIDKIEQSGNGITLEQGSRQIQTDYAVVNADYPYAQTDLLKRKIPNFKYSCSTFLIYLGLKKKISNLVHHNLFFSGDLDKNLDQIFKDKINPIDPSFYVHVPTVTDPSLAPAGKEILYLLIPITNLENSKENFEDHKLRLRKIIFDKINQLCACNLDDLIEIEEHFYPQDFISRYNIKYGATFGLAHNLTQSAFFRPVNFDKQIKNLYYVGASTQPGGGLPVVLASSRIVANLIKQGK